MEVNHRIRELRESKDMNKSEFSSLIGVDSSQYSKVESGKLQPTINMLMEISSRFSVSIDWLLKGYQYNSKNESLTVVEEQSASYNIDKAIPLLPVDAYGGNFSGSVQVLKHEAESYIVPIFSGADFLIPVKGNSMYPKYNSGDLVACKKIESSTFFQWGKVYVISSDQGVLIKRVMSSINQDSILLVSENAERYPAFELPKNEIHSLAIVIGVIRLE